MILGFKEFFDTKKQKPTYFKEKILLSAGEGIWTGLDSMIKKHGLNLKPKLHTIREDSHDRWKPVMSIQMVYRGASYKIIDEFNKGIPELSKCVSTQKIEIKWSKDTSEIGKLIDMIGVNHKDVTVTIDGKWYSTIRFSGGFAGNNHRDNYDMFYQNDGFDNLFDFFVWFKKDFTGKIIHFTDLRY